MGGGGGGGGEGGVGGGGGGGGGGGAWELIANKPTEPRGEGGKAAAHKAVCTRLQIQEELKPSFKSPVIEANRFIS